MTNQNCVQIQGNFLFYIGDVWLLAFFMPTCNYTHKRKTQAPLWQAII